MTKFLGTLSRKLKQYMKLKITKNIDAKDDDLYGGDDDRFNYPLF